MAEASTETRLSKLEQATAILSKEVKDVATDLTGFMSEQRDFRQEWRRTKEIEATKAVEAAHAGRLTLPQMVAMGSSVAAVTALLLGGLMWMINSVAGTVRSDMLAQQAQIGLQVRGMTDSITATQTAVQAIQRDLGTDRVKLGLVEQTSMNNARVIQTMESYDAQLARQDEQIKALQQQIRDMGTRLNQPR
jgi:regulator of replication initiation timing